MPIIIIGSLNADLVVRVDRFPIPGETVRGRRFEVFAGGKGGNQAVAAARLGGQVAMVGQVGGDSQGAWLRTSLEQAGVDAQLIGTDDSVSSGVALITTDADGQNEIVVVAGANGTFTPDRLAPALPVLRRASVALVQLEIPMATVERAAAEVRAAGGALLLDPAPAADVSDQLLALATLVTPNESELAALSGTALDATLTDEGIDRCAGRLLTRGASAVLVKVGARGARLVTASRRQSWPACAVQVVDTTAAGDAFNGALAVALAERADLDDAIRFACAAGALSVTRAGAQSSMPTRDEVDLLLARTSKSAT